MAGRDNKVARVAIQNLEIENFRGIERLSLDFKGPDGKATGIVVLGGPNGSGKTTVLEACLIGARQGYLVRGSGGRQAIRQGAADYKITASLEAPTGLVVSPHGAWEAQFWKEQARLGTVGTDALNVRCAYFSSWRAPQLVGPVSITAGRTVERWAESEENRLSIVKQYLVNAKAHAALARPRQGPLIEATVEGSIYDSIIRRLDETWEMFHAGSEERFSVEPVSDDPDAGFDVFLVGPGDRRVPLDALSSGELELFNFVGWMLAEKFEGGIIFIDEPELHLDPQWHALILRALRKLQPTSQFIVATHSPAIYDSVLSFERHFLVPPDDPRAKAWGIRDLAGTET